MSSGFEGGLLCGSVAVIILLGAAGTDSGERLPGNLGGFLTRLIEVAIVAPQVSTVLATLYDDAARPCRPDSYGARSDDGRSELLQDKWTVCAPRGSE